MKFRICLLILLLLGLLNCSERRNETEIVALNDSSIFIHGCTEGRNVRGIVVSQEMIDGGDMKGVDYCLLYKNALDGDSTNIRDYSTIETFDGGFIYVHGVYLIRLVDRVGEELFLKAIKGIDKNQREMICLYIKAGMDIYEWYPTGEGAIEYSSLEDYWDKHPQLYSFVKGI